MLHTASQKYRQLSVSTPFGDDVLLLRGFSGRERLSGLFEYELDMLSADGGLDPRSIIGQRVTWVMDHAGDAPRHFNGFVSRFSYVSQSELGAVYRATVVPWLWFLAQTRDCRIFQHESTPDIVARVFQDLGFADFAWRLTEVYEPREYCVQYRESDLAFVARLLEEEGIAYRFRHQNGSHELVLFDQVSAYFEADPAEVDFADPGGQGDLLDQLTSWEHSYELRPGRWSQRDYNFEHPTTDLSTSESTIADLPTAKPFEIYDYPGRYGKKQVGRRLTRVRMQEYEVRHDTVSGSATYRHLAPGGKFRIATHRTPGEVGKYYVLTEVQLSASVGDSYKTGAAGEFLAASNGDDRFECRFQCLPANVIFRPARQTPRPIVEGPQTAVVVGPEHQEIYTDSHGRVKVQFHWDRQGRYNENSSCWLRVSQVHAGAGWGGIDLPRIGEEVIVDFLEGDPDAPIITGRVYNGQNQPPFALPAGMTRSGMKSNTHKGSGSNEISIDDTAGKEQIRTHAQHNMDTTVGNNQTLIVNVDRTDSIGNNDSLTVGVDAAENVGNNKKVSAGNNINVDAGKKIVLNAGSSITLKCGASKIHMNSGGVITITGAIITVAAAANAAVAAPMTQVVGGAMLTTMGAINVMSGAACLVKAGALASVAGGKVDVIASGTTAIKGGIITLN